MRKLSLLWVLLFLLAVCSACSNREVPSRDSAQPSRFTSAAVGDTVTFGKYEQDNNTDNGSEAIEWIVIDKQDGKILLLSKYCLDRVRYNEVKENVTWETCTLRSWMNSDFLNAAFSAEEQKAILTTNVDNSSMYIERGWNTPSGNKTQDLIFSLSYKEANQYFGVKPLFSNDGPVTASRAAATPYAAAKGALVSKDCVTESGEPASMWWLRTLGSDGTSAGFIRSDGLAIYDYAFWNNVAVRPALWLSLK